MKNLPVPEMILNILEEDTPEAADMRKIMAKMIRAEMRTTKDVKQEDCDKCKALKVANS